jgi:hypothetical protein
MFYAALWAPAIRSVLVRVRRVLRIHDRLTARAFD